MVAARARREAASRAADARRLAPLHAYRLGAVVAQALPTPIATAAAQAAAVVAGRASSERRRVIARHLQRISGGNLSGSALSASVDRAFASYGRYWLESFRLPTQDARALESAMSYEGIENLEVARSLGRGVIMAMPHLGAWDWGGAWLSASGFPLTVVAEALEPPELFEWFAAWRRNLGMTVVPLGNAAGSGVMAALRRGEVVGLLCDRDLTGDGVEVEFFGEMTRLPAGPATLALRTGAPLLACCVLFEGDHHRGIVLPPIPADRRTGLREDVVRVTQSLADSLASLITRAITSSGLCHSVSESA